MALEQDIRRLSRSPLLGALGADALRLIAFSAEPVRLAKGDVLFRRGDPADAAYFVAEGAIGFHDDDQPYDDAPRLRPRARLIDRLGEDARLRARHWLAQRAIQPPFDG